MGLPRPAWTSEEVEPPRVSEAEVLLYEACAGVSWVLLEKVLLAGAEPAGRTFALNSGTASLPTRTPGLCCDGC
jgi:hypothetical protein